MIASQYWVTVTFVKRTYDLLPW